MTNKPYKLTFMGKINHLVYGALSEIFSGDPPVCGIEPWNAGYIDELTDEAVGIYRLEMSITEIEFTDELTQEILDQFKNAGVPAPDHIRFDKRHFILYWLDEAACRMVVEYSDDE